MDLSDQCNCDPKVSRFITFSIIVSIYICHKMSETIILSESPFESGKENKHLVRRFDPNDNAFKELKTSLDITNMDYIDGGTFGRVYEGYNKDGCGPRYAIKVLQAENNYQEYLEKWYAMAKTEADILAQLNRKCTCESTCEHKCEYIVKHYKTIWLKSSPKESPIYAVFQTELLNINLKNYQLALETRMPLNEVKRLAVQIGEAIVYMHKLKIVHHDIKALNVMMAGFEEDKSTKLEKSPKNLKDYLAKCTPRVIDFGLSKKYPKAAGELFSESTCWSGTTEYKCPEKKKLGSYDPYLSDSFSFGMMIIEMLMGIIVFEDRMQWKHKNVRRRPTVGQVLEDYLRTVQEQPIHKAVRMLVAQDENERIHVSEAIEMIRQSA